VKSLSVVFKLSHNYQ